MPFTSASERLLILMHDVLCHGGDLLSLTDTTSMGNVGLDDVDTPGLKVRSAVETGEQSFSKLSGQRRHCMR